jgi:hypothetical protein
MNTPNGTAPNMPTPKEIFPLDKTDPTTKTMKENEFPVEHTLEIMRHVSVVTKGRKEYGWRYWKTLEGAQSYTSSNLADAARKAYGAKPHAPVRHLNDTWAVWVKDGPPEGDPFEDDKEEMEPEHKTVNEWARPEGPALEPVVAESHQASECKAHERVPVVVPPIARPDFTFEHLSYLARELYRIGGCLPVAKSVAENERNFATEKLLTEASDWLYSLAIQTVRAKIDSEK